MALRWSEEEYRAHQARQADFRRFREGQMAEGHHVSEKVFQDAVIRLAQDAGYTFAYHTYRSTKSLGGFPDLILCHREPGHMCYAIELKTDTGIVSEAQQAWLTALAGCRGVVAEVWRPRDLEAICQKLRT